MNTSLPKKIAAVLMLFALTLLSGCSYDIPEGYKKHLHSYEEALEYAKKITVLEGVNNKEFQLLEYLMNNPDRILSREMFWPEIYILTLESSLRPTQRVATSAGDSSL